MFYLCEDMKEKVPGKEYIMHEGIYSKEQIKKYKTDLEGEKKHFRIVYTGKLTIEDGVLDLIDAVKKIQRDNIVLKIAGGGGIESIVKEQIKDDSRIIYYGRLDSDEVRELQKRADLFVVPRLPEDYTRYSFPSKVVEYILTDAPILCHKLDCFGVQLNGVLTYIKEKDNSRLCENIIRIIDGENEMDLQKRNVFIKRNMNTNIGMQYNNTTRNNNNIYTNMKLGNGNNQMYLYPNSQNI